MKLKNIFYALSFVFALGAFTACDDDENNIPLVDNPGEAAAGVYSGTWTRTANDGTILETTGTITITADDEPYYANMALACDDASWNMTGAGWSTVTNIAQADEGFALVNMSANNGLGAVFSSRIDKTAEGYRMALSFTKSTRVGLVTTSYTYDFVGVKAN